MTRIARTLLLGALGGLAVFCITEKSMACDCGASCPCGAACDCRELVPVAQCTQCFGFGGNCASGFCPTCPSGQCFQAGGCQSCPNGQCGGGLRAPSISPADEANEGSSTAAPYSPIVRVDVPDLKALPNGMRGGSLGSGALVYAGGGQAIVITNCHVVRDGGSNCTVEVRPSQRGSPVKKFPGTIVAKTETYDLAAILIADPANVAPIVLGSNPQPGETLTINGFGSDGTFREAAGRLNRFVSEGPAILPGRKASAVSVSDARGGEDFLELACQARKGDSGGPILNANGELAGLLNASNTETVGVCVGRIQATLQAWFPNVSCWRQGPRNGIGVQTPGGTQVQIGGTPGTSPQGTAPIPGPATSPPPPAAPDTGLLAKIEAFNQNLANQGATIQTIVGDIADVKQQLAGLNGLNGGLSNLNGGLSGLQSKIDQLVTNGGVLNKGVGSLVTALGAQDPLGLKTQLDAGLAAIAAKAAAPVEAVLSGGQIAGLAAAGGIPGLIAAAFAAIAALKKNSPQ